MNFNIKREELLKGISIIERGVSQRSVVDALRGIKIEVSKKDVTLTSSNSDIAITYTIDENIEIIESGSIVVPGSEFITIIKKTEADNIAIVVEGNKTFIKTFNSTMTLMQIELNSYPAITYEINTINKLVVDKLFIAKAYNQAKFTVANNNARPVLSGINFRFDNNAAYVESTDAKRLTFSKFDLENSDIFSFILPKQVLKNISSILNLKDGSIVTIKYNATQIVFIMDNLLLKASLIDGEYPQISELIPTNIEFSYEVKTHDVYKILEKISSLSSRDMANVSIELVDGKLLIKSHFRELGALEEYVELQDVKGTPFPISFDPAFIIDAINSIGEDELVLEFSDSVSPFIIKGKKDGNNIQVISPMRVA